MANYFIDTKGNVYKTKKNNLLKKDDNEEKKQTVKSVDKTGSDARSKADGGKIKLPPTKGARPKGTRLYTLNPSRNTYGNPRRRENRGQQSSRAKDYRNRRRLGGDNKVAERIGNATKGTVKNTGSSFMNTFATLNADANTSSIKRHDLKAGYARDKDRNYGGKNRSVKSETQRRQETKSYEKRVDELRGYQDAGRKPIQKKASQLRASGNADIEKAKEGLGKVGKFGIDLYSQMLQWGGDAVIGAATGTGILAPMFFRSFGDTSMTARESGASRNKQILAGAISGSVEAATEKIFSPFEIMKKTAGKGLLDNIAERTAYNLTKKLTKQGVSKELTYKIVKNAVKAGVGMIEEGSEEVASSLFQPAYESIYDKNALEQYKHPIKTGYLKQIGSDFTMGAAMAGVLGGGGAIVNKAKGNTPQETFTESEKKQIIKAGKAQGENTDTYSLAVNLEKQQASGEEVLNGQIADLANKVYREQYNTEKAIIEQSDIAEKEYVQNLQTTAGSTDMMKNDRRINGSVEQVMVDQVVAKRVAEKASHIESLMVANGENAESAKMEAPSIARIVLGTATAQDMTVAAVENNGPRAIIEAQTGVKLPYTNQETINALSVYAAGMKAMQKDGVIKEARTEARIMASQLLTTNLDEQTATIFNKGMENLDFNSLPQYVEGFNLYYQGGTVNYDYGKILKTYDKVLPEAVKMAAYNAGNQVYLEEQSQVKEAQKKVVKSERRNGSLVISEKHQKKLGSEKSGALRTFVEVSGKKVVVVDQIDAGKRKDIANGKYKDGTIFISAKSDNPIFDVLKHELTHNLQETAPEAYNELKQFVFKRFYESDQKKYDSLVSGMIERYAQSGVELTRSQAEDELLADATDVFFKDADMIQSLVNENRSLAEKLVKGIRALLDTLHRMATGNKKGDWLETLGIVEEAQRLWVKALNESIGVETDTKLKTKYQINDEFYAEFDNWISTKSEVERAKTGGLFTVGTVSDVLNSIGMRGKEVRFGKSKIAKIMRDHPEMTPEIIRQVPQLLENPIVVMQSKTRLNSVVVLGDLKGRNGDTVIAAMTLDTNKPNNTVTEIEVISSAYTKPNKSVQGLLNTSSILYVEPNKNRTNKWLTSLRVQFPSDVTSYGSIENITYVDEKSNGQNKNNVMEQAFKKAEDKKEKYSLKDSAIKNFNIDKAQILDNMKIVTGMESVCDLDGSGFEKQEGRALSEAVMEFYGGKEFTVHNDTIGDIKVGKRGVKSDTQHKPIYGAKIESFKALKEVISSGQVINVTGKYGGNVHDRVMIVAPISIGEKMYYMGVVINRNADRNNQSYYIHDVILTEKNSLFQDTPTPKGGTRVETASVNSSPKDTDTQYGNTCVETVSPYIILQQLNNINSLTEKDIISDEGSFQLKDGDEGLRKKVSELEKTNKKLKAEFKRSKYAEPDPRQAGIAVSRLIEAYLGRRDGILHNSVMPDVKQVFAEMRRYEGNWNLIDDLCLNVADKVVDKMEILHDEMWTQYKDLRDTLRGTTLKLSENYWNDIADFDELRKSYFGTVKLAKKTGVPIDTFYQELAETYPELFDAQEYTNEVDQMYNILEVVESMKPYVEEYSKGEVSEFKEQIAKDVLQMAYDLSQKKTFADLKHDEKLLAVEKVKAERNSLMDKQKVRMQSRLDKKDKFYKNKISDIRQKYKDTKSKKYYTSRIEAYTQWMSESLLRPTETKHIPNGYAKAIATMLSGFDFSTTKTDNWTRKYGASIRTIKLAELRNEYEKMSKNEDSTIEIDEELQELLNQLSADLDGKRFADLSIEELDGVYRIIKQVRFSLSKMNKTFSDGLKDNVSQYGDAIISDNMSRKNKKQYDGLRGEVNRFLNEANVTPIDMFECVGGKMYELYQNMRRGFDRHVDNVSQSKDFISSITEKYKVKKWIDDNARAKKFKLENGSTIELVPSQVMSLYCLVDRKQAIDHILGSGVTASPIGVIDKNRQRLTKGIAKRRLSDAQVMPTINDVKNIVNTLTTEQKEVADALQKFMGDTCSEWGNETSLRLYGYKKFTEKNYFPIKSSDAFLDESFDKVQAAKIKNVGFTKNTVMNASNPIVLDDIFSVFSHHVNTMSMYNALVPALTDFERVYNYKQRSNDGKIVATVQKSIQQSYGDNVNRYIRRFVNDVNQNYAKNDDNNISSRLIANYKKAKIGANLRVLVQQPTAIVRASVVMNPIYLVAPGKISLKEMQEHCQIARWKSWGFYNTDVSRSMRDIFLGKRNIVDTLFMEMYGKADDFTWSVIWNGVKKEIKARRKDLKPGTDAYWKAVNERFSYVVDRTQVVDSVFHRSQIMRSQDLFSKTATSFMAEPTKNFNMLRTELVLAGEDIRDGKKKSATARVMRANSAYIAQAITVAMASALVDALRARGDDDEDKDYLERWQDYILENFKDNVNPLNMLPLLRDFGSIVQGYDVSRMDMDGIADLVNSIIMWESDTYTLVEKVKSMVGAVSSVTGLPIGNVTRDVEAMAKEAAKHFFPKEYVGYFVARFKYDITNEDNRSKFMAYYIKAMKNGNTDVAKLIEDDMKANGIDSEYMRGRITSAFSDEFNSAVESNDTDKIEIEADKLVEAGIDRATVDKKVKNALGSACNDALENEDLGTAYEIINTMEEYGFDQDYIERKKRDLAVNEIASYIRIGREDRAYADAYAYHDDYGWQVNALIERAEKIAYGN